MLGINHERRDSDEDNAECLERRWEMAVVCPAPVEEVRCGQGKGEAAGEAFGTADDGRAHLGIAFLF